MIKYSVIICIAVFCFSCKKDKISLPENEVTGSTSSVNYSPLPLEIGNYWIYQRSVDDSIGTYILEMEFDSVYVEKDTTIINEHYFKIVHTNQNFMYYFTLGFGTSGAKYVWIKDSLGFLITRNHQLLLDTVHLLDTVLVESYGAGSYGKTVPDQFFNQNFYIGNYSGFIMKKCFLYPITSNHLNGTNCYQAFVKNIGLVRARMLFTSKPYHTMFSQHLIRYHLN